MENTIHNCLPYLHIHIGKQKHKHLIFKIFIALLASATIFTGTGATLASAGINSNNGRAVNSAGLSDGTYIPTAKGAYIKGVWSPGVGKLPYRYSHNIVLVRNNAVTRLPGITKVAEVGDHNYYFRDVVGHLLLATNALHITHTTKLANWAVIHDYIENSKGKNGMPSKAQIKKYHLEPSIRKIQRTQKRNKMMMEQSKALYDSQHGIDHDVNK